MRNRNVAPIAVSTVLLASLVLSGPLALAQNASEKPQHVLELSLADTVELALRHNLQVRIASLDPDIAEEQIRAARAIFDPVLTFDIPRAFNRSSSPTSSVLGGADVLTQEQIAGGFSFQNNTGWGLNWSLSATASRFVTNNTFSTFNPRYDTQIRLDVRQPLLRNFGSTPNKRQLMVASNDHAVSRELFREQLQNSIFRVIQAYWQLVNRFRALDIQRQSLQLAQEQLQRNNTMVRIGVLAAVDVIQTEQQVADAELSVIQAQIALQNQQDLMKSLLNLDAVVPEGWDVEVVPTDDPATDAPAIDVDEAVQVALSNSPTIRQDRTNLDSRRIDVRAAHNQLLPQLDFVANMNLDGLGGDQIFRAGNIFGSSGIVEVQEGGVGDSFQQLLSGDFRNWSVGLQLAFPIRNDQAKAQFAQASIRERQAVTQVQDREIQLRLGVHNAVRNVDGGTEQVAAAKHALGLAERQYAAELRRFETGTSSTFQVLSFQRQLTLARQRELNSVINLNLAIANFELNKGTLLDVFGIQIDEAGSGGPMMQTKEASSVPRQRAVGGATPGAAYDPIGDRSPEGR